MRSALKKSKYLFVGFLIFCFVFATPVRAETWNAWFQGQLSLYTFIYAGICQLIGCGIQAGPPKADSGSTTPTITYNSNPSQLGGVIGFGTNTMVAMYTNPPTSSMYYLAKVGEQFGVTPAYAQVSGSGASMLRPVEQLWQILRNVSYMFFILIFVAIGFMIMLKQKLNAQTVITVQSALPGLVIGLILVTFSYFIAALITDLAFFGVQLVAQIFASVIDKSSNQIINYFDPLTLAQKSNIFDLFWASATTAPEAYNNYPQYLNTIESAAQQANPGTVMMAIVGGIIFALTGGVGLVGLGAVGTVVVGYLVPLLVVLILLIAFTIQFLKLVFKLLMAYIMILLNTALGPVYITFSMLPGRGNMVGMWWKNILGNALVFPAVFAVFLFAGMIMKTDQSAWASTPPLFGNFSTQLLQPIIAFVILLGTPAVPDMVKKAVGATDLGAIGSTGTAGFMAGYGAFGAGVKKGGERITGPLNQQRDAYQKAYASWLANGAQGQKPSFAIPAQHQRWWRAPVNAFVRNYVTKGTT